MRRDAISTPVSAETGILLPQRRDERVTQRGYYFAVYRYQPDALDGIPREVFRAALEAEGVPASIAYGVPVYRYAAFSPDALQCSPLRGLANVPAYHELNLPVVERISQREQLTIPHQVLLSGPEGVQLIVDAVAKIAEHRNALHAWSKTQAEPAGAAST